jgi:hypothetical protein
VFDGNIMDFLKTLFTIQYAGVFREVVADIGIISVNIITLKT